MMTSRARDVIVRPPRADQLSKPDNPGPNGVVTLLGPGLSRIDRLLTVIVGYYTFRTPPTYTVHKTRLLSVIVGFTP